MLAHLNGPLKFRVLGIDRLHPRLCDGKTATWATACAAELQSYSILSGPFDDHQIWFTDGLTLLGA